MLPFLVLALLAAPSPQETATPAERFAASNLVPKLDSGLTWEELRKRNERASFTPLSGRSALAFLTSDAASKSSERERAMALVTLGANEMKAERARLEAATGKGNLLERQAATLGLGRLGPGSTALLLKIAADPDPLLAECALLALTYSGQRDAREYVERRAQEQPGVAALIAFVEDPSAAPASAAGALWLELRFAGARRFGLIDGRAWRVVLLERLAEQRAFLDQLVYRSARDLRRRGVQDHYLGLLYEDPGEEALRAVVAVLPNELSQMVMHGLWTPASGQWAILIDEIGKRGLETLAEPLLIHALGVPEADGLAALLLVRAGNLKGRQVLEAALKDSGPELRRKTAESLGDSGDPNWQGWLAVLREDPDPEVSAAALVAQARLGNAGAKRTLGVYLANPNLAARDLSIEMLVHALAHAVGDTTALDLLEGVLPELVGTLRLDAATALAESGRAAGITVLRKELQSQPPSGELGARMVQALGRFPDNSDVELLLSLFPQEDDVPVNAALAEALLRARSPLIGRFLRAAMWKPPFHRGMLAAALLVDLQGIDVLRQEVETPQLNARPEDLRRVGFALGTWGGLQQVDLLAGRVPVGDPALQGAVLGALAARTY